MRRRRLVARVLLALGLAVCGGARSALAHQGPPFPLASSQVAGPYEVSVWTDPDSTDDGVAAGRFWVTLHPVGGGRVPPDTRVTVSITPTDRAGAPTLAPTERIDGDAARRFVALLMDHEGPFRVRVAMDGALGHADLETTVEATYDQRPAPILIVVFLMPFVLVGFLWIKLLLRRRQPRSPA